MNFDEFKKLVMDTEVNKKVDLPETFRYKYFEITKRTDSEYSWVLDNNY